MSFRNPPTHDLREEWRLLDYDRRKRLIELSMSASQEENVSPEALRKLDELGISEPLASWLMEEGVRQQQEFRTSVVVSSVKTPLDRFNSALGFTIVLMAGLIWLRQEIWLFERTALPIGFILAVLFDLLALLVVVAAWRKWFRAFRRRD